MNSSIIPITEITKKILDACQTAVTIADKYGNLLYRNAGHWEQMERAGVLTEAERGSHARALVSSGNMSESVIMKVIASKKPEAIEQRVGNISLLTTGVPILDADGELWLVVTTFQDFTEINRLRQELARMGKQQDSLSKGVQIIAESKAMQRIMELSQQVAQYDSTCLISGESGVGKEVVARYMHASSSRFDQPFVKVNCGAIPHELLESELFGYEGGAFTGAKKEGKIGKFESAEKGTLFLDEIGELSLSLQVKLLEVLQDKAVVRVGGTKRIPFDVKIIAATNRNLEQMVKEGKFRLDLYYRLNILQIEIPPLRERPEDIPPLIEYFLQKLNKRYGKQCKMSQAAIRTLMSYSWPGNVRELSNVVERMLITSPGNLIGPERSSLYSEPWNAELPLQGAESQTLKDAMERYEKEYIADMISRTGSMRKAAAALGVNESTISRKAQKYGIQITKSQK